MAHLPNLSALALDAHALWPIGARKRPPAQAKGRPPSKKQRPAREGEETRRAFERALNKRIDGLVKGGQISAGKAGWKPDPGSDSDPDSDADESTGPKPHEGCCTGGRLEDHLPEGLRTAYEPPSPAARRVINDPEALAIANEALAKAALQLREVMTQEEWVSKYGAKRMAQIASIVRALGGSPACKPPDPLDQRYSKRSWNGAVRRWAGGETRARAEARRPDEPESEA